MREKIILAPGANRTELMRSLALYGKGSFGVRIYNSAYSLASDMLLRRGIVNDDDDGPRSRLSHLQMHEVSKGL